MLTLLHRASGKCLTVAVWRHVIVQNTMAQIRVFLAFHRKEIRSGGTGVEISTKFQAFPMALPQQGPHPKGPIGPLGRCVLVSLG